MIYESFSLCLVSESGSVLRVWRVARSHGVGRNESRVGRDVRVGCEVILAGATHGNGGTGVGGTRGAVACGATVGRVVGVARVVLLVVSGCPVHRLGLHNAGLAGDVEGVLARVVLVHALAVGESRESCGRLWAQVLRLSEVPGVVVHAWRWWLGVDRLGAIEGCGTWHRRRLGVHALRAGVDLILVGAEATIVLVCRCIVNRRCSGVSVHADWVACKKMIM